MPTHQLYQQQQQRHTRRPYRLQYRRAGGCLGSSIQVIVRLKFRPDRLFTTSLFNMSASLASSQIFTSEHLEYENRRHIKVAKPCVETFTKESEIILCCEKLLLFDKTVYGDFYWQCRLSFVDILSLVRSSNYVKIKRPFFWQWSIDRFSTTSPISWSNNCLIFLWANFQNWGLVFSWFVFTMGIVFISNPPWEEYCYFDGKRCRCTRQRYASQCQLECVSFQLRSCSMS